MELNFDHGKGGHLYHTLTETDLIQTGGTISGAAKITGFTKSEINKEDELIIQACHYKVVDVSRRDHAGHFENPQDKKNTFFEANCTFTRAIRTQK